jgi:hypothetical protein
MRGPGVALPFSQPLTVATGSWDAGVTLTYQWTVAGADVAEATGTGYTPVPGDVGKVITVKVTGTKTGYATMIKESAATSAVDLGDLTLSPVPTINGTPKLGSTVTASAGAWDGGTALAYEWHVDGTPAGVSVSSDYTLRAADVGRTVTVSVTGTKPGYHPVTRTSAATAPVQPGTLADSQCVLRLAGKAKVGKKLSIRLSACPAGATLRYQWYAGTKLIAGANGATLKLKAKYAGKRIGALVTVSLPGYQAVARAGKSGAVKDPR